MNDESAWWTAPTESDNGQLIMVTGRKNVKKYRENPRFNIRVEVTWRYTPDKDGMPDEATSKLMEEVQDAIQEVLRKDPVAVLTGIFTGASQRDWIFYTLSTHIFGKKINEALATFPLLPIEIYCENDSDWAEYDEMTLAEVN